MEIDGELHFSVLNLFGAIEPKKVSHDIRGQNVVVRALKAVDQLNWPRLLAAQESDRNVKYDCNNIKIDEIQIRIDSRYRKAILKMNPLKQFFINHISSRLHSKRFHQRRL